MKYFMNLILCISFIPCASNQSSGKAIHDAIIKNDIPALKKLITQRNINSVVYEGNTPLIIASRAGKIKVVKFLLDNGADVNKKNKYGDTAINSLFHLDEIALIKLLISKGADVNASTNEGVTPLMMAALSSMGKSPNKNYHPYIKLLIKSGANVNAKDANGNTPLFYAAIAKNPYHIGLLLEHGAKKGIKNNEGVTPLFYLQKKTEAYKKICALLRRGR